jgi:hypothetical protein
VRQINTNDQPMQKTRPHAARKADKPHKPFEIPVPTRKEVFDLMRGVSGPKRSAPDSGAGE